MNELARHIEFLLRRHDCVVIPGWGALLCNYEPAHFVGEDNRPDGADADARADGPSLIAPPARYVAFNELIQDNDGLLGASVARREGVAYEAAMAKVGKWVDELRRGLDSSGTARLGRIGSFVRNEAGHLCLESETLPGINGPLPGLRQLEISSLAAKEARRRKEEELRNRRAAEIGEAVADEMERRRGWRAYATGIVASLAVLVTAAMFLISPIRISQNAQTASLVPTAREAAVAAAEKTQDILPDIEAAESACGSDGTLSVLLPGEEGSMTVTERRHPEEKPGGLRFSEDDPFCVIVASFPTERQAETYLASQPQRHLGILAKDGKFRIYAATGADRQQAESQRAAAGEGAWVCRR